MTSEMARIFCRDRYVVLPSLLKEPKLTAFDRYACKIADSTRMAVGDDQVSGTPCAYGDFMVDGLLIELQPEIEKATGLNLFPTYSYLRIYKQGDELAKHIDRESCEISVSLCLGYEAAETWPLWIEGPHGAASASLHPGDALLYRGTECPHWRERFEGERMAQVFMHYVDRNGPYAQWKFDKRELVSTLRTSDPEG